MTEQILELLRSKPKQSFNARQLARHLDLSSGEHKDLRKVLKELTQTGKIMMDAEERYSCRDVNKILKGTIQLKPEGYGFFCPDSQKKVDVFVPPRHTLHAMSGDTVLVESVRNSRDGRFEGQVVQILERAHKVLVGTLKKSGGQYFVESMDGGAQMELYIPKKNLLKAVDGDLVVAHILQYPGPGVSGIGEIQQVIGDETNGESLTEAILLKHSIHRAFPTKVQKQASGFGDEIDEQDRRIDLSDLPIITIDGITAKDFDDAVCVLRKGKTYVLYVCIADVAEYVKPHSALDQEAYKRGSSTYLPDECIPMLPEKLSNGLCSLNPHVPRYTLTAEIHYNDNFEFTRASFYKSIICSHKRATYAEVQAYLDGSDEGVLTPEVKKSLDLMNLLSKQLMKQADARGILNFDMPEAQVVYDVHGKIQAIQKSQRFYSHRLIEVFMIAANVAVAQYFSSHGLPLVFRVHEQPDSAKIQMFIQMVSNMGLTHKLKGFHPTEFFKEVSGHPLEHFLQMSFLRSLKQAKYQAENIGHFGLQLEDYAHFTSPIRRYPDLLVHRQLRSMMDQSDDGILNLKKSDLKKGKRSKVNPAYSFEDLQIMGAHCSKRERESEVAEREVLSLRKALFMKGHTHDKFFGLITRVTKNGLVIELDPHYVEGFLPVATLDDDYYVYEEKKVRLVGRRTRQIYKVGDRIWVTVLDSKPQSGDIRLALAEKKKANSKAKSQKKTSKKRKAQKKGKKRK